MKIEMDKKYRTRGGREVRIYCTNGNGSDPIHGAVQTDPNIWTACGWRENGKYLGDNLEHGNDLIEDKPRIQREVWLNIHSSCVRIHSTKKQANTYSNPSDGKRFACVKVMIDCEEGEGLDD